jgi:uncharacterized protein YkwD
VQWVAILMMRVFSVMLLGLLVLAGCDAGPLVQSADSTKVYRISAAQGVKVQDRLLEAVNLRRIEAGVAPLVLNSQLNAAAAAHSRDMAAQNRPWHFGSDASSPIDRVARTGYPGLLIGENISETYETELQTLDAWMAQPSTRDVILDPAARDLGFAWHQEQNGKLWWTLVTGGVSLSPRQPAPLPIDS